MPRKVLFLVLGCLWAGFSSLAQPFSAVVSFGDSLSDTTNNPAAGDYWEGRWSNGPLWNEYLAQFFGATLYDYAFAGSESSNLAAQVTAASKVTWDDTNTLFTVWSGANDFIDNAAVNGENIAAWSATVQDGVKNVSDAVGLLAAGGARFIVVLNLPDLSQMPAVIDDPTLAPEASFIRYLAGSFNIELGGMLNRVALVNPQTRIVLADDFSLLDQIVASPAKFGFTVVTNDALMALNNPALDDAMATNYLFWDLIHPTTKAHTLVANLVETKLAQMPPTLIAGPAGGTVAVGASVEFVVIADGGASYQWLFDGMKIKGATNATYTIASAKAGDAGSYAVILGNAYGKVQSAAAKLKVETPPRFVVNPRGQNGIAGKKVLFNAAAAGTGPITYQWQFEGSNIAGATKATLLLTNLDTNDAGIYASVAKNPVGVTTSKVAMLNVIVPPSITSQPQGVNATVGDAVTFSVTASGTAPLRYQWEFNGVGLPHQTNMSLTIPSAKVGHAGKYRVLVRNAGGSVLSANAVLKVVKLVASGQPRQGSSSAGAILLGASSGVSSTGPPKDAPPPLMPPFPNKP